MRVEPSHRLCRIRLRPPGNREKLHRQFHQAPTLHPPFHLFSSLQGQPVLPFVLLTGAHHLQFLKALWILSGFALLSKNEFPPTQAVDVRAQAPPAHGAQPTSQR